MSKILIDTESKSVAFLDAGGGATVVAKDATATIKADGTVTAGNNPATGQPITVVPGYVSEWATLLTGLQSVDAGKANPTQSNAVGRPDAQRLPFIAGKHYDLSPGAYVFQGARGEVALHVKADKAGLYRVSLAGTTSGAVQGGASSTVGDRDKTDGPQNIAEGNLDGYGYTVTLAAGGYLNQFLRIDGGDADVHFRVIG